MNDNTAQAIMVVAICAMIATCSLSRPDVKEPLAICVKQCFTNECVKNCAEVLKK